MLVTERQAKKNMWCPIVRVRWQNKVVAMNRVNLFFFSSRRRHTILTCDWSSDVCSSDLVPPSPGAWLTTTASRKAIDRIRRENKLDDKQKEAQLLYGDDPPEPLGAIDDERLRLIFTCCHPALAMETRVALTLRMVGGLTVPEIARAFLVQESTVEQRITRAKA